MKRLAILFLLIPSIASASPLDWAKHHKRFLLMESTAVAGAIVHREGLKHCRLGDVERCDENYGSAWAWYWVATGWSTVVGPSIAEACWHATDDARGCYFFAYSGPAYQTAQGIYDFRAYKPKEARDTCRDLKCEEIRFRRLP